MDSDVVSGGERMKSLLSLQSVRLDCEGEHLLDGARWVLLVSIDIELASLNSGSGPQKERLSVSDSKSRIESRQSSAVGRFRRA